MRKPASPDKPQAEVSGAKTADGYVLEARLPVEEPGHKDKGWGPEAAFQLCVNDVDETRAAASGFAWYPGTSTSSIPNGLTASEACRKRQARQQVTNGCPRLPLILGKPLAWT